jgi:hypothetical protein
MIAQRLAGHRGYQAIQHLPGVGPVLAAVFVAEIGRGRAFRRPPAPVLMGRFDPHPRRIRHRRAARTHH